MELKLQVSIDVYSGPEGKEKLFKKGVLTNYYVDSEAIISHQEVLNSKGNIHKNRCRLYIRDIGQIVVNHTCEEISQMLNNQRKEIGFFRKKRK